MRWMWILAGTMGCAANENQGAVAGAKEPAGTCTTINIVSPRDAAPLSGAPELEWTTDCAGTWLEFSAGPDFLVGQTLYVAAHGQTAVRVPTGVWRTWKEWSAESGYWRIRGATDGTVVSSETRTVGIAGAGAAAEPSASTCSPTLDAPADGTDLASNPEFAWSHSCDGVRLEFAPTTDFSLEQTFPFGGTQRSAARLPDIVRENVISQMPEGGFWRVVGGAGDGEHNSAARAFGPAATDTGLDTGESGPNWQDSFGMDRPRLYLKPKRLDELRANACFDAEGTSVVDCTPTVAWEQLAYLVENKPDDCNELDYALYYMVTGQAWARDEAIALADERVADGPSRVASANTHFLYVRDSARAIGSVYDWLHDELTADQRADYANYMTLLLYLTWNDTDEANAIHDTSDWATDNTTNNFYYNFLLATAYIGVVLDGENPGEFTYDGATLAATFPLYDDKDVATHYGDPLEYVQAKFDLEAIPGYLSNGAVGGGWHEGDQYGTSSKRHICEAAMVLRDAGQANYFQELETLFSDQARYHAYSTQPGGGALYQGGDGGRDQNITPYDYDRHLQTCIALGLRGTEASELARTWTEEIYPSSEVGVDSQMAIDFLLDEPTLPESGFDVLDPAYHATGSGWVHSRDDWTDDAVAVSFVSTDHVAGHQHNDQNGFQIFGGGPGTDGWQIGDNQPYGRGLRTDTRAHNTIIVDEQGCQRAGDGAGRIDAFEQTEAYSFARGDAGDAYYTDQKSDCYSDDGDKQLDLFLRELVHVRPGVVVVYDRVQAHKLFPDAVMHNNFHFPYDEPVVTGNVITHATGGGDTTQTALLPEAPSFTLVDEWAEDEKESWRLDVTYAKHPGSMTEHRFLNAFHVTLDGSSLAATRIDAGALVGAEVAGSVVLFSSDGNEVSAATYDTDAALHVVTGLVPGSSLDVSGPGLSDSMVVSAEGVLAFETTGTGTVTISP